ncbi:MAG: methylglyoxal synthase [Anaerolineae bacterium]|nr:methylglyoxal synthase [Anaerolineae bacterium]
MESRKKRIALVADEQRMPELLDWAKFNRDLLAEYEIYTIGSAVSLLTQELEINIVPVRHKVDDQKLQQSESDIDFLVVFVEASRTPFEDPDVKALLDNATFRNVPIAGNRRAADHMFPSCLALSE